MKRPGQALVKSVKVGSGGALAEHEDAPLLRWVQDYLGGFRMV